MTARTQLLQLLRDGLEAGFCLDWQPAGWQHGWPGPALLSWALRLRQRWRKRLPPRARIVVSLPNSPAYLAHWLAAWQGDWVFCPLPPLLDAERNRRLQLLRPQLHVFWADGSLREDWQSPATVTADPPELATIFWTSASLGAGTAYGMSYAALRWQLHQHAPALGLQRDSLVRNTLPWSHAFAGVLELLPAICSGVELRVAPIGELRQEEFSHLCTVPRVARLLASAQCQNLDGGIVGGAPLDAGLAEALSGTRLRVGYGQTEAGPGITLGTPGDFRAAFLGSAVAGVEIRWHSTLQYRSPGQSLGRWTGDSWVAADDTDGWIDSGDLVAPAGDEAWRWCGRRDAGFKLANGLAVQPEAEELRLQTCYPELQQVVLGGPGQRHLAVLASTTAEQSLLLRRRWQEPLPLYVLPAELWQNWQNPSGKPRRQALYGDWNAVLRQAQRL